MHLLTLMRFLKPSTFTKFTQTKQYQTHNHPNDKKPRPNELLKHYLKTNNTSKSLHLFRDLIRKNTTYIDSFSLLYIIKTCTQKLPQHENQQFHTLVIKLGYETVIFIQTSLVQCYSALGHVADAHHMFDEIQTKNVVCWTALISAYVDNEKPQAAIELFREMQRENVEPDQVTLTVILSACADLGALDMGKWVHKFMRGSVKLDKDLSLYNSLLNMYMKCGDVETAKVVFDSIENRDVTTWTSMITGYAIHGRAKEALVLFKAMTDSKVAPNDVTFIGVLMACSHVAMVDDGKRYFRSMVKDYEIKPRLSHFGCMVDLLCRAGCLQEAKYFILEMPMKPNSILWRTLLSACSVRGDIDLAEETRGRLLEYDENLPGDDVIMGNMYASRGIWDKKEITRNRISERRVPGCSSIEVGSEIIKFIAGDRDHPFACIIYEVIHSLMENMRGYVCNIDNCDL